MADHLDNLGEPTEIEGVIFRISKLGYKAGRQLAVRLAKKLGPSLAQMAQESPDLATLGEELKGLSPAAIGVLFRDLEDADLEYFDEALGKVSRFSTDGTAFMLLDAGARERLFAGKQMLALKWKQAALKVQYADFLAVLDALPVADQGKAPTPSE